MSKVFLVGGKKVAAALCALTSALFLMTSCDNVNPAKNTGNDPKETMQPSGGPLDMVDHGPAMEIDVPVPVPVGGLLDGVAIINVMARTDPANPQNERYLDDWIFQAWSIDDRNIPISPVYGGVSGWDGTGSIFLPSYMLAFPLIIRGFNEALPPAYAYCPDRDDVGEGRDDNCGFDRDRGCTNFEIFVPPYCAANAVWLLGPYETAVWRFYRRAAERAGEAWNPTQVDCGTWLANLSYLLLTDLVVDELSSLSFDGDFYFNEDALIEAIRENTHLLTPTRPPICMAENRHDGGGMQRGDLIHSLPVTIDQNVFPWELDLGIDSDPIVIGTNGVVDSICGIPFDAHLSVNTVHFEPTENFYMDDSDFMGTIHDEYDILPNLDAYIYNVRLGDGEELDSEVFDDSCALSTLIEFQNKNDDEYDIFSKTGVHFHDLFGPENAQVWLTSDGDNAVDDNDYWVIFYNSVEDLDHATVITVELLGQRQGDFRDNLHITFDPVSDNLFVGLRADYELNEEEIDGERAFVAYTLTTWDGSDEDGREDTLVQIANCYEASDVWARQFFNVNDFMDVSGVCCVNEHCEIRDFITPLRAAEFAVRSQCFSNSIANQRWRTEASGFWAMNSDRGVAGDVIVNPGWLAPWMDYEIYIQKFDEAVFKGPRTILRTDGLGMLMGDIPTLVEGDRILIKSEDNCCDDYDLVIAADYLRA